MVISAGDNVNALYTVYWTGLAWNSVTLQDSGIDFSDARPFDFAWEATGSKGLLVYGTTSGQITYRTFTAPSTWSSATNVAMGSNTHKWVQLRTNLAPKAGTPKILGAALEFTNNDLGAIKWDGSTFTVIGSTTFTAATGTDLYESFDLEFRASTSVRDVEYIVCKDLSSSSCDAASEFTKFDGSAGVDTVATGAESGSYPSLATTFDVATGADLWVSYGKDVDGTTRGVYVRFLDYPSAGFAAAETVDSLSGTIFTKLSIGIDSVNNVHALYVSTSSSQVYYKKRTSGTWGSRQAVGTSTDSPTIVVRTPTDAPYGTDGDGLYWKTTTSETYFFHIPEFETTVVPVAVCLIVLWGWRGRTAGRRRSPARGKEAARLPRQTSGDVQSQVPDEASSHSLPMNTAPGTQG